MIEIYDSVTGVTTGTSSTGTFVDFGDRTGWIGNTYLPQGVQVTCSVWRIKPDGFMLLNLDSVRYHEAA